MTEDGVGWGEEGERAQKRAEEGGRGRPVAALAALVERASSLASSESDSQISATLPTVGKNSD